MASLITHAGLSVRGFVFGSHFPERIKGRELSCSLLFLGLLEVPHQILDCFVVEAAVSEDVLDFVLLEGVYLVYGVVHTAGLATRSIATFDVLYSLLTANRRLALAVTIVVVVPFCWLYL